MAFEELGQKWKVGLVESVVVEGSHDIYILTKHTHISGQVLTAKLGIWYICYKQTNTKSSTLRSSPVADRSNTTLYMDKFA